MFSVLGALTLVRAPRYSEPFITDPKLIICFIVIARMVSSGFLLFDCDMQVVWGSVSLVGSAESKVFLKEYYVVGAGFLHVSVNRTL
jgi:hypothetical protein